MNTNESKLKPKILVFSTEKISDLAIDMAGLLKLHYPATAYTISVPCSSGIKPHWILHALKNGFDGVFIAADGTDCPYSDQCTKWTGEVVAKTHLMMKEESIKTSRLKMAAICSVCSEAFVRHIKSFYADLSKNNEEGSNNE